MSQSERSVRQPLTRAAILDAALAIADTEGLDALSMRRLGGDLGVEAMSLYHHVSSKDDLLAQMGEQVWNEVELVVHGDPWRQAVRRTAKSAHEALLRHSWALALHGSLGRRAKLRYLDSMLGHLRSAGLSAADTYHAQHVIDAHILGYTMQAIEYAGRLDNPEELLAAALDDLRPEDLPHLMEHVVQHAQAANGEPPVGTDGASAGFEIGLDLILDGLSQLVPRDAG